MKLRMRSDSMKKLPSMLSLLILFVVLLYACGTEKERMTNEMNYKTTLPEDSSGLELLVKDYMTSGLEHHLISEDGINIYAKENLGSDEDTVEYLQFSDKQLKDYYQKEFNTSSSEINIKKLRDSTASLFESLNDETFSYLPEIKKKNDNVLDIKTEKNNESFILSEILEQYEVNNKDEIIFNLVAVDESSMQIDIENKSIDDSSKSDVSIFISQDLENVLVIQTYTEEFVDHIASGEMEAFESLLEFADKEGRFIKAVNSPVIMDTKTDEIIDINDNDIVSNDFKYVYLDGNEDPLSEGTQHIQTLGNYVDNSGTDYATYELDYAQMSDELDLQSADDVSIGNTYYFNEDFIVLFLDFKAPIAGESGSTNVIIDMQEDKENPIVYLSDLGLH